MSLTRRKTLEHFDSIISLNFSLSPENRLGIVSRVHFSENGACLLESARLLEGAPFLEGARLLFVAYP